MLEEVEIVWRLTTITTNKNLEALSRVNTSYKAQLNVNMNALIDINPLNMPDLLI